MTFKDATKLHIGDTIYLANEQKPFKIAALTILKDEKIAKIRIDDGQEITHKEARFFPKPDKTKKYADQGISIDEARALCHNDLVFVKERSEFVRVKSVTIRKSSGLNGNNEESAEIELLDGSSVRNEDVLIAPKDARAGKAPF